MTLLTEPRSAMQEFKQAGDDKPKVTVVVPAYNEEGAIAADLANLKQAMDGMDIGYEIVVVDDGSEDSTATEAAKVSGIRLLSHCGNKGYGAALKTGIRHAKADTVVIIDADGTYPPRYIPELVAEIEAGADMAVGARTGSSVAIPAIRKPAKWVLAKLASFLAEREIPDLNSGLRAFRKDVIERFFGILPSGFSFTTTITLAMICNGYNVTYRPIDYLHRVGSSKIRPIRDTYNFMLLIIRTICYFNPLKVLVPPAFVIGAVGFAKLTYDVFWHRNVAQAEIILLLGAAQLLAIGVVADMISKLIGARSRGD